MLDPMDCLRDGVPPLLLIDLFGEAGPDAVHIYEDEPADVSWTHPLEHHSEEVDGQLPIQEVAAPAARDLVPEARGESAMTAAPPTSVWAG